MIGGCQPCPKTKLAEEFTPKLSTVLGRGSCESAKYLYADQNNDGEISQREALRFMYYNLNGQYWGEKFYSWADLKVDECDLTGITCNGCGEVSKIDLTEADLCSVDKNTTSVKEIGCGGLPAEIKYFNGSLESFVATKRLRGKLPSEFGALSELKILDLHGSWMLSGSIPSEFGKLTKLQQLDLSGNRLNGTLPSEMFQMEMLEKLRLHSNHFEGPLPSEIGNLRRLKELRISRAGLNGTLPSSIGDLRNMENLEIYGNKFSGRIPQNLKKLRSLKRFGQYRSSLMSRAIYVHRVLCLTLSFFLSHISLDIYGNNLTGPIPEALGKLEALQVLHFKKNELSGEIPSSLGTLPNLLWFDASLNLLSGTIPETFGSTRMLKDLRLHGNRYASSFGSFCCLLLCNELSDVDALRLFIDSMIRYLHPFAKITNSTEVVRESTDATALFVRSEQKRQS